MAEQEKVGKKEFEIFLLEKKFATIQNIDMISKQFSDAEEELKKSLGVNSIPSFYSDAKQYMLDNPISIDSTGKIETNIIKRITKKAEEKEIQEKQIIDEERKKKENIEDITRQEEIDEKKKYEARLQQIKAVDDTIEKYGGIEKFLKNATSDEINQFTSLRKEQQVFDDVDELIIRKIHNPDYVFTQENHEKIMASPLAKELNYNSETRIFENVIKAETYVISLEMMNKDIQNQVLGSDGHVDVETVKDVIRNSSYYTIISKTKSDQDIERILNEKKQEFQFRQDNSQEKYNEVEYVQSSSIGVINDIQTTTGNTISIVEMQEFCEEAITQEIQNIPDYAEEEKILKDEQSTEEIHTREGISDEDLLQNLEFGLTDELNDFQIEKTKDKKEIQTEDQPQQEPSKENKYETPTFEVKRTGLAGLFSMIANSRAAKAVTNLFKPKAKQDRLGPAQPHKKVENGLEITTYEGGGNSIEPLSKRVRSFARNMGAKIMEGVVSITNLGRGNKETNQTINTPIVIGEQKQNQQIQKSKENDTIASIDSMQNSVQATDKNEVAKGVDFNDVLNPNSAIYKDQPRGEIKKVEINVDNPSKGNKGKDGFEPTH